MPTRDDRNTSVMFWFKRSEFYVAGMDFVFSRIALMCQTTAITFYLKLVCGYVPKTSTETPWQLAFAPAISFLASLVFSLLFQDKLQTYHEHSKYNLFLYSVVMFSLAGILLGCMVKNHWLWTPLMLYPALVL